MQESGITLIATRQGEGEARRGEATRFIGLKLALGWDEGKLEEFGRRYGMGKQRGKVWVECCAGGLYNEIFLG